MKYSRFVWVDPPSGWQYGFPKIYDQQGINLAAWLALQGYPQKLIELDHVRYWEASQADVEKYFKE